MLADKQNVWSWPRFVSVMLRRLRRSLLLDNQIANTRLPKWRSSVSLPLVPLRTISLVRWVGRQFYRGSDFPKGLSNSAWPLDNVENFSDEILHVVGGGGYWKDTYMLSSETRAKIEKSLTRFREPFSVMKGLTDAAIKLILRNTTSLASAGKFKAVQLRLGDIDSIARKKLVDTAGFVAELWSFGFTEEDAIYLATDDNPKTPFLDEKILFSAFPSLLRKQELGILGQECDGSIAPPLPASSEQETTVSPWSRQKDEKLEGPRCVELEQAICARAAIFVGSRWSSFGPRIGTLRATRGKEACGSWGQIA